MGSPSLPSTRGMVGGVSGLGRPPSASRPSAASPDTVAVRSRSGAYRRACRFVRRVPARHLHDRVRSATGPVGRLTTVMSWFTRLV